MQTEDLWIVPLDHAWAVRSDREGIVSEGHDCRASAQDFIDERRAAEDEARQSWPSLTMPSRSLRTAQA
jgi:hypothetical protein